MEESLFDELKRYVGFGPSDESALRAFHPIAQSHFQRMAEVFYDRILAHEGASKALKGGESTVGRLKVTLVAWMHRLLLGPWDEEYFDLRCRIGRVHVRIALPQHYMFGAMNVARREMQDLITAEVKVQSDLGTLRTAVDRILDLELAIMLHTYREDLLAQQSRTERLATFGQLAGSIGHELRNPLGVIESSLFILKGRVGEDERVQKHVERISEQVALANHIVTSLLDMIRDRPVTLKPRNLGDAVNEAVAAVARPAGVRVHVEGVDGLEVIGDLVQLRQVFWNLLENAVHASSPEGDIWIRGRPSRQGVEVVVSDSGPGVDSSISARLFEPLITTKTNGIGLGLALVKRIVERHGGSIQYGAAAGGGATFTLLFSGRP